MTALLHMDELKQKQHGAYYTPDCVVRSLVRWVLRKADDTLLDPSCGDGRFLHIHANSVGVECDGESARIARANAPAASIIRADFFSWAPQAGRQFDCAVGNPPFIRYQRFAGQVRRKAQEYCRSLGVEISSLASSWAPFIVAAGSLLKSQGRMAFVVPAEIGHAPYARPVLEYLCAHFGRVQVIAIRQKLFPGLSEDCWLLLAREYGGASDEIGLSLLDRFDFAQTPPPCDRTVRLGDWANWNYRLRPFVLGEAVRDLYRKELCTTVSFRLGDVARVGIGYVSGDNDFFHLRPSEAKRQGIDLGFLQPTVRNGRTLPKTSVTPGLLQEWIQADKPVLLLRLNPRMELSLPVKKYLESRAGDMARSSYKCRNRQPWYVVPDVTIPDGFLSYMTSGRPHLVSNGAGCTGTNSVHVVRLTNGMKFTQLQTVWAGPLTELSCEIEGHPLGGGMLKMEPREAARVVLSERRNWSSKEDALMQEGVDTMRRWRKHG